MSRNKPVQVDTDAWGCYGIDINNKNASKLPRNIISDANEAPDNASFKKGR